MLSRRESRDIEIGHMFSAGGVQFPEMAIRWLGGTYQIHHLALWMASCVHNAMLHVGKTTFKFVGNDR